MTDKVIEKKGERILLDFDEGENMVSIRIYESSHTERAETRGRFLTCDEIVRRIENMGKWENLTETLKNIGISNERE